MTEIKLHKDASLRDLIAIADSFEMSWSISATGFVEKRYLLFFDHADKRSDLIASVARDLGVSAQLIAQWQAGLSEADAMGLAFNTECTSVRLYLQYWDRLVARVENGNFAPHPLYIGLKSLPNGQIREDVYICHPQAPQDMFLPAIRGAMARIGVQDVTGLDEALTPEACIFTTIAGEGRNSFLATVRRAGFDPQIVAKWMEQLPATPWAQDLRRHAEQSDLLHIAGGEDALKGSFTTLYFSCTGADL